jgi:membrane peptidoglycan carboxypeptidase
LVGDYYALGRSRSKADIQVNNDLVSGVHVTLERDRRQGTQYVVRDQGSRNGLFWGRRPIQWLALRHGDWISLGPPELAKVVEIQYLDPPSPLVSLARWGLYGIGGLGVLMGLVVAWEWQQVSVKVLGQVEGPIAAYAEDGTPLETLRSDSHVELATLEEFSPFLPDAVVASEDSRFYWHFGFDPVRIGGAIWFNLQGEREGASTVTQQIARSLFPDYVYPEGVGTDDGVGRKLREIMVALKLETFYSKDKLLLTYLNRVYLGVGYGFEDAAQEYFRKSARDLTLSEAAMLVGILPGPNLYNPCEDLATARGLRDRVISRMLQLNMITEAQYYEGIRSALNFDEEACNLSRDAISPYFYGQVIAEMDRELGPKVTDQGHFIVETSLNPTMQGAAEMALRDAIRIQGQDYGFSQGAIVTLDAQTGAILALVGGADYQESQFNRASQALRQPGSTFKIFAYTAALDQGVGVDQTYSCGPLTWRGQSFSACERSGGAITMDQALAQSENAVALRVAQQVGLDRVVKMAQQMGVKSDLLAVPGLVLGQSEVTLLEITGAFAVLANGGTRHRPHAINRILDSSQCANPAQRQTCPVRYDFRQDLGASKTILSPQITATMTEMLQGVVTRGTGRAAQVPGVVPGAAGKTGTTNDGVDLWFVGYLPSQQWVTGVWLGNDDNSPTDGGSWLAAQLWGDYMGQVLGP